MRSAARARFVERASGVPGVVLDACPDRAGVDAAADALRDRLGALAVAVLGVNVDGNGDRAGDARGLVQRLVDGQRTGRVGLAERVGDARAGGADGREAGRLEQQGAARVPRVRHEERAALVQAPEAPAELDPEVVIQGVSSEALCRGMTTEPRSDARKRSMAESALSNARDLFREVPAAARRRFDGRDGRDRSTARRPIQAAVTVAHKASPPRCATCRPSSIAHTVSGSNSSRQAHSRRVRC